MIGLNVDALEERKSRKRFEDSSLAAADSLALPMDEELYDVKAISSDGKAKAEMTRRILTRKIAICFSSVLLVAIIVLSVVLTRTNENDSGSIDASIDRADGGDNIFSKQRSDIYSLLESRVHDPAALLDMDTPEGRAFNMLVQERKVDTSKALRSDFYIQRYALHVLYFGTNGEDWTNTAGWSTRSEACEELYGVVCKDSLIIGIDLDRNNLNGKLSEDFCLMNGLTFLRISENVVELPRCLPKLSQLHELDFRRNGFVGGLPFGLYSMPSLKSLELSDNDFSGSIDTLFANAMSNEPFFPNLRTLNLANNNLSGEIPEGVLRRLPSLDELLLHGNPQLSGSLNEMCKGDRFSQIDADCDVVSCRCCTSGENCPSSPLSV